MKKICCFIDKEKEEQYINIMASQGLALTGIRCIKTSLVPFGIYEFEPCEPDEYVYRIDYLKNIDKDSVKSRIKTVEKSGAELISERQCILIFRKKEDFHFKIKDEVKQMYYNRLKTLYMMFFVAVIVMLAVEGYILNQDPSETPAWMMIIISLIAIIGVCMISFFTKVKNVLRNLELNRIYEEEFAKK